METAAAYLIVAAILYGIAKLVVLLAPALLATTGSIGTGTVAWAFGPSAAVDDIALICTVILMGVSLFLAILSFKLWRGLFRAAR